MLSASAGLYLAGGVWAFQIVAGLCLAPAAGLRARSAGFDEAASSAGPDAQPSAKAVAAAVRKKTAGWTRLVFPMPVVALVAGDFYFLALALSGSILGNENFLLCLGLGLATHPAMLLNWLAGFHLRATLAATAEPTVAIPRQAIAQALRALGGFLLRFFVAFWLSAALGGTYKWFTGNRPSPDYSRFEIFTLFALLEAAMAAWRLAMAKSAWKRAEPALAKHYRKHAKPRRA